MAARFEKATRKPRGIDEKLKATLSAKVKPYEEEMFAPWEGKPYKAGDEALFNILAVSSAYANQI